MTVLEAIELIEAAKVPADVEPRHRELVLLWLFRTLD
jgi:hypothetical protein